MLILLAAGLMSGGVMSFSAVPPARGGDIAILEELCVARSKATLQAYDLFIARHPGHKLVREAKEERQRLAKRGLASRSKRNCGD